MAYAQQKLADALDQRYPSLTAALAAGSVLLDQARAIAKALDTLPATSAARWSPWPRSSSSPTPRR